MATPKKPAAKSTKAAKTEKTSEKAAAKSSSAAPLVNLSNAASSAATLLANRAKRLASGDVGSSAPVNAAVFNQIKNGLAQPQHSATSPLAGLNSSAKPAGTPGFTKQTGQGQAAAANVARTGVPRRTSGG